jgi:hypothetical protein
MFRNMSFTTKATWIFLLAAHLIAPGIQGQPAARDSVAGEEGYSEAVSQYHTYLTPEANLFRGPEYVAYDRQLRDGHPYYGENSRRMGSVYYNGIFYPRMLLLYDLVQDLVIINDPHNYFTIGLIGPLVDSFSLEAHFFLRLSDSLNPTAPRNGFYERLYQGRIIVLKKEKKRIEKDLSSGQYVQLYVPPADSSYYLKIGNTYYSVNNNKSLLYALKDKKKEARKFMRSNHLSMRNDRENTLLKVSAWYDTPDHYAMQ